MKRIKDWAALLTCCGMVIPQAPVLAASPKSTTKPATKSVVRGPLDIALAKGGTFQGRLVDDQGSAIEGAAVTVRQAGRVVAETSTQEEGRFSVSNLKGGIYEVKAGKVDGVCRLWSPDTAPPSAANEVTIVSRSQIVRGQGPVPMQDDGYFYPGTVVDPLLLTAIGLGAAGLTVGIIALDHANDAEDAANASP